jgi:rfaE bifunctional protein nucleotidyltransferase chain/domain
MAIITMSQFAEIRKKHAHQKIVFCAGSFDLTHSGHVLFFEDGKKYGDILVVGVGTDHLIRQAKGLERPILNEHLRLHMINSFRMVDYCFLDTLSSPEDLHAGVEKAFEELQPDVYLINSDAFDIVGRTKLVEAYGIKFCILDRTCPEQFENISTTAIIEKIKKLC